MTMAAMDVASLYGIRLRTPRLELRLGSTVELLELQKLARAGIHPPEVMPFYVPWTDDPDDPGFVTGHHAQQLQEWRTQAWSLNLLVWAEGALAGSQGLRAQDFLIARAVDTGSWLGRRFQGRGYGTEMRAAAVELSFRGLGAERVTSGAFEDNLASIRVSEKLGYRVVGEAKHAPRGLPQREIRFELNRADWRPPVPVAIEGLEPALPHFGL